MENAIFINGKAQIIEMLQHMPRDERRALLAKVRLKNSQLADELSEQCFVFADLSSLPDHELSAIFPHLKAAVLGMAIKGVDVQFQRRLLSLADRDYAQEAFRVLKTPYKNEKQDTPRAQNKIVEILASLKRKL